MKQVLLLLFIALSTHIQAQTFTPQNVIRVEQGTASNVSLSQLSVGVRDSIVKSYNVVKASYKQGSSTITTNPLTEVTLLDQTIAGGIIDNSDQITLRFYGLVGNTSGVTKTALIRVYLNNAVVSTTTGSIVTGGTRRFEIDPVIFISNNNTATSFTGRGFSVANTILGSVFTSSGNPLSIKVTMQVLAATATTSVQRVSSSILINDN